MHGQHKNHPLFHIDKRQIEQRGIILPIQRLPLRFFPGRHVLGRAGEGMRFLRNRPYEPLVDNPRDIDKFSPHHALTVNEWEHESHAEILILVDVSASMAYPANNKLRNSVVLQLIYSLWRAGDKVRVALFAQDVVREIREANLQSEMQQFQAAVMNLPLFTSTNIRNVLQSYQTLYDNRSISLIFLVSDFISLETTESHTVLPIEIVRRLHGNLIPVIITFNLGDESQGVGKVWDPERNCHSIIMMSRTRKARINTAERIRVEKISQEIQHANLDFAAIQEHRNIYPSLSNLARIREHRRH